MSFVEMTDDIAGAFLSETRRLCSFLRKNPSPQEGMVRILERGRDNAKLCGFLPVAQLLSAVCDIYVTQADGKIIFTENTKKLVRFVADKVLECCDFIEAHPATQSTSQDGGNVGISFSADGSIIVDTSQFENQDGAEDSESLDDLDIRLYLLYCDKAVTGELFDADALQASVTRGKVKSEFQKSLTGDSVQHPAQPLDEIIKIKSSNLAEIINMQEEMIARTYIISNQIDLLKKAISESDTRALKDTYKLLQGDSQTLQNSLLISHDQFLSLMHDDTFLKSHQEMRGFFVFANGEKYLIPSQFIFDVICFSPSEYVLHQNQKYAVYVHEDETGEQEESEEIPVYALSSLLPGQHTAENAVLDTILLADYQSQRIGIIVDSMQKFVSIIKKSMPPSFRNFPAVQGVAFDEKYDMIPILYLPEIMRRFRSLRGYDVKKFEAYTKKHVNKILVVDDSKTTRQIQSTILTANGFLVDEAADGIDAMEKIKKKQFDVIVCDDVMPRMNGEIFLDNVRRMENYADIPVVALSERPIAHADAFVGKSDFTREKLIQKIGEVLHE